MGVRRPDTLSSATLDPARATGPGHRASYHCTVSQRGTNQRMRIKRPQWIAVTAAAVALTASALVTGPGATAQVASTVNLGPNVTIFDDSMSVEEIQAILDAAHAAQVDNEMGTQRYAFLFRPGTYGTPEHPLQIKVGYYTEIAGLGDSPDDVVINGKVEVYNRCLAPDNCIALVNFWRTLANLSIVVNATGQDGCRASANFWAVSQAVSLRRISVSGGTLSLMDYCTAGPSTPAVASSPTPTCPTSSTDPSSSG